MSLRSLLFWRRKPTVESVSAAVAVRNALRICVYDFLITEDQFEELYCAVLENEVYGPPNASEIINQFIERHELKKTPESIARYQRFIEGIKE